MRPNGFSRSGSSYSAGRRTADLPGWFLVQIISQFDLSDVDCSVGDTFSSVHMIEPGLFQAWLEPDVIRCLSGYPALRLWKPEKVNAVDGERLDTYYVRAGPGWHSPSIIKQVRPDRYVVNSSLITPKLLLDDPMVLSVERVPKINLKNRFTAGVLRGGALWNVFNETNPRLDFVPPRFGFDQWTGAGEIVSVVDTGLDYDNPFFYGGNLQFGVNMPNQRKVFRYDAVVDKLDERNGHGTHVAGTVAGSIDDASSVLELIRYEGIAPGAKLHFIDVGDPAGNLGLPSAEGIWVNLSKSGAKICSNSWGTDDLIPSESVEYDAAAYNHSDVLWVFASGNEAESGTQSSPGTSKNVLTVGATTNAPAHVAAMGYFPGTSGRFPYGFLVADDGLGGLYRCWNYVNYSGVMDAFHSADLHGSLRPFANLTVVRYGVSAPVSGNWVAVAVQNSAPSQAQLSWANGSNPAAAFVVINSSAIPLLQGGPDFPLLACDAVNGLDAAVNLSLYPGIIPESWPGFARAPFSSYGPNAYGTDHVDVVAPGNHYIFSARSWGNDPRPSSWGFGEGIMWMGGTSMATPAISGLAALFRQFLASERFATPTSAAMRAVLVASAERVESLHMTGHGLPQLRRWAESPHKLYDNLAMPSGSHQQLDFSVSVPGPLRVVLSYIDPPVAPEASWPFYADLNLVVRDPANNLLRGNGLVDQFSTLEEVIIPWASTGDYQIHVSSSVYPTEQETVRWAIAILGASPAGEAFVGDKSCDPGCRGECNVNGSCMCDENHAGPLCEDRITPVNETSLDLRVENLGRKEIRYFSLPKFKDVMVNVTEMPQSGNVTVCLVDGIVHNIAEDRLTCQSTFKELPRFQKLVMFNEAPTGLVYCASPDPCTFTIHFAGDIIKGLTAVIIAVIVIVVLLVVAGIVAVVVYFLCCKGKGDDGQHGSVNAAFV